MRKHRMDIMWMEMVCGMGKATHKKHSRRPGFFICSVFKHTVCIACTLFLLVSCGTAQREKLSAFDESTGSSLEDSVSHETKSSIDITALDYKKTLDEYYDYFIELNDVQGIDIDRAIYDDANRIAYAVLDINDDGVPELIITTDEYAKDGGIIELYTYVDNKIVRLLSEGTGRNELPYLCENNAICLPGHISGSWNLHYYSLGEKPSNLNWEESVLCDDGHIAGTDPIWCYSNPEINGKGFTYEESYEQIQDHAMPQDMKSVECSESEAESISAKYIPKEIGITFFKDYEKDDTEMPDQKGNVFSVLGGIFTKGTVELSDRVLLANDPLENSPSGFVMQNYDLTGGVENKEGKYALYTDFPENLSFLALDGDFAHDGRSMTVEVEKLESKGGRRGYISIKAIQGNSSHAYDYKIGENWSGESVFCYIYSGSEADYLVLESVKPSRPVLSKDVYYLQKGSKVESIRIISLKDFSNMEFESKYDNEEGTFEISEDISMDDGTQHNDLYFYKPVGYLGSSPKTVYHSYDEALSAIQNKLAPYGLEKRVGKLYSDIDQNMKPLFILHRNGIHDNILLSRTNELVLYDTMSYGTNPQYSGSKYAETQEILTLNGVWDSDDGEMRMVFDSSGMDYSVTYSGIGNADGTVKIIDLQNCEITHGSFSLNASSLVLTYGLSEHSYDYSVSANTLRLGNKVYHSVNKALIAQLVGEWENEDSSIKFADENYIYINDNGRHKNGRYAVLDASTLVVSLDGYGKAHMKYSINGNVLNYMDSVFTKNGSDTSYNSISSLSASVEGTWHNERFGYYVLKQGLFERYLDEDAYNAGRTVEEGFYEVISANEVRLYTDINKIGFQSFIYNHGVLIDSIGNVFSKN